MFTNKHDWEKTRQKFEAWWQGGSVDGRPILQILAPWKNPPPDPPAYSSFEERWLDLEYRITRFEWDIEHSYYYAGDAFPIMRTDIGPGTLSLYLGAQPEFGEDTVWYHPCVKSITEAQPPVFDESNKCWQATLTLLREAVKRLDGYAMVGCPDLIENVDTVAALIGNKELLTALIDYPEKVHELQKPIVPIYMEYFNRIYDVIKDEIGGSCFALFSIYGHGKVAKLQCDFSAMISPKMFGEFVVPYLVKQIEQIDYTVYHWDGVLALPHEEHLLGIEKLNAIQWTPGAGQPGVGDPAWWPLHHRTRKAGKSLLLLGVMPHEVEPLVKEFGPDGLNMFVWADSEETADELARLSGKW